MLAKLEIRTATQPVALGEGEGVGRLSGYIARYNEPSALMYDPKIVAGRKFVEIIRPGAFTRTLSEASDIVALYNHEKGSILGRTSSGTLTLTEDEQGLAFSLLLPDTQLGRDSRELVARGDVTGCSFGFYKREDELEYPVDPVEPVIRSLLDVDLYEVTPLCLDPAYEGSEVELRSAESRRRVVGEPDGSSRYLRLLRVIESELVRG
jgi:HK97 family phage prohead protease